MEATPGPSGSPGPQSWSPMSMVITGNPEGPAVAPGEHPPPHDGASFLPFHFPIFATPSNFSGGGLIGGQHRSGLMVDVFGDGARDIL